MILLLLYWDFWLVVFLAYDQSILLIIFPLETWESVTESDFAFKTKLFIFLKACDTLKKKLPFFFVVVFVKTYVDIFP